MKMVRRVTLNIGKNPPGRMGSQRDLSGGYLEKAYSYQMLTGMKPEARTRDSPSDTLAQVLCQ